MLPLKGIILFENYGITEYFFKYHFINLIRKYK